MMFTRRFANALKEVFLSSLPLAAIIVIVCGIVAPLEKPSDFVKLAIGYIGVVLGQAMFLEGLNQSILPIGKMVGSSLFKFKRAFIIVFFGFVFGVFATVAEPALSVLARQTGMIFPVINEKVFIWVMGAGIGVCVAFALFRIIRNISIKVSFFVLYLATFLLVIFVPEQFVALAFDGSGATTGDISVPFILALGLGVSNTMSRNKSNDDTFGIVGLASVGPIIALFIYGILMKALYGGNLPEPGIYDPGSADSLIQVVISNFSGIALAISPIILVFLPFQLFIIKLPKREFISILIAATVVYVGLLIFLSGIDYGFAFAGKYIGEIFLDATRPSWFKWLLLGVGFILGVAITLSEPAVNVLGEQLEDITNGYIKKTTIRMTLAVGIGFAATISMLQTITEINILWFLTPLYIVSIIMMRFASKLFVGLAFDSGGVTGGALTSAFLTPLTLGVAQAVAAENGSDAASLLTNGFGIIAFISVTPLIAVQFLGILYASRAQSSAPAWKEVFAELSQPSDPYKAWRVSARTTRAAFDSKTPASAIRAASARPQGRIREIEDGERTVFLTLIAFRRRRDALIELLSENGGYFMNVVYVRYASSAGAFANAIGFVPEEKRIKISCMMMAKRADKLIAQLSRRQEFESGNGNIAFTMPIEKFATRTTSARNAFDQDIQRRNTMKNSTDRKAVHIIVNSGFADEAVQLATEAGAKGATIVNARGTGAVQKTLLGISVDTEKDMILCLADARTADEVMTRVQERMGHDTPAKGLCFIMPVDNASDRNE